MIIKDTEVMKLGKHLNKMYFKKWSLLVVLTLHSL